MSENPNCFYGDHTWLGTSKCVHCGERLRCACGCYMRQDEIDNHGKSCLKGHKVSSEIQNEMVLFIDKYFVNNQYPPTCREIGKACAISNDTVVRNLEQLKKKGTVTWQPGKPRTLKIIKNPFSIQG